MVNDDDDDDADDDDDDDDDVDAAGGSCGHVCDDAVSEEVHHDGPLQTHLASCAAWSTRACQILFFT